MVWARRGGLWARRASRPQPEQGGGATIGAARPHRASGHMQEGGGRGRGGPARLQDTHSPPRPPRPPQPPPEVTTLG